MKRSRISYVDYSAGDLGFVLGCTPISAGCRECYARRLFERFGRDFSKVTVYPEKLERLRTRSFPQDGNVRGPHTKPLLFPVDLGDLFHPAVPAEFITYSFEVMGSRQDVDWIVLTKRPERMVDVLFGEEGGWFLGGGDYEANIILGVTAEDQENLDRRWPILRDAWMGPTMLSIEPCLGPVSLAPHLRDDLRRPSWVIVGAESGPNRRPFDVAWAEVLYRECRAADIPFFFKQGSALRPGQDEDLPGIGKVKEWPSGN